MPKNAAPKALASRRRRVLREGGGKNRIDALLVSKPEDVSYLSGFTGEDSFLLVHPAEAVLITDGRYQEQAHKECADIRVHVRTGRLSKALANLAKESGIRRLGVQAEDITLAQRDALASRLRGRRLVPVTGAVAAVRITKDEGEVRAIRRAVRIAQRAFCGLIGRGAAGLVGRRERDVAAELDYLMRQEGADGPSFDTIVAAGANAALPHHRAGGTRIRRDAVLLIDWGARVDGYCSDLTRTLAIGRIPPKLATAYELVRRAQRAGLRAVRPRVKAETVDAAAREIIEKAGFGRQFLHGLGHGLGREVHERPGVGRTSDERLRAGMLITIEPGIYLPRLGGIRIEDDVLVTPDGRRRLSSLPRGLESMTLA